MNDSGVAIPNPDQADADSDCIDDVCEGCGGRGSLSTGFQSPYAQSCGVGGANDSL